MNTIRKTLLVGMAVLSLGAVGNAARAQDAPAHGRHGQALSQEQRAEKMAEHKAKWSERVAKRQAKLHEALKLSAAQEPAWTAFAAATAPQARGARPDRAALAQLSAPERMEKRLEMHKQMLARHETRLAAVKTFYAQLTAEQKKTFDDAFQRHHGRGHGDGHGRGHGGMMRHG